MCLKVERSYRDTVKAVLFSWTEYQSTATYITAVFSSLTVRTSKTKDDVSFTLNVNPYFLSCSAEASAYLHYKKLKYNLRSSGQRYYTSSTIFNVNI